MKFFTVASALAIALVGLTHAADVVQEPPLPTPQEALTAAQAMDLPVGVKLTGTTEPIQMPASASTSASIKTPDQEDSTANKEHQEQWGALGWGGLGWAGWGNWGGWGGFGPYRFGYTCGGLGGWAYPLGYWNAFGAGLWGGSCGLGIPFGGLFYC